VKAAIEAGIEAFGQRKATEISNTENQGTHHTPSGM
jgi:hypothetical protein